ncbi:MAG: hypothetical protein U5J63_01390 [Fodinibius sp.]|nr:hypothetical protein [Fodinibius sp.]
MLTTILPLQAQQDTKQEWKRYDLDYRAFRVTLVPGLSTNGIDAANYAAKYSLNILGGYHGALHNGYELGALVNINKYYARGLQVAGIGNISGNETAGLQIAGLGNISGGDMLGLQMAGIGNLSSGNMQGLQLAGMFNLSGAASQGLQLSGMFNIARSDIQGLFGSGIGNLSGGDAQGLLWGGVFNIADENMQGIAGAGVLNYSSSFQGIAAAPVNITGHFKGIQMGTVNVVADGQGIQLGLINYGDKFQGVPVGLISYYKDGRKNIDSWVNSSGFTNVGIKLGTEGIYNMVSVGYNPLLARDVWQLGWSIGRLHEYETHSLYTDFSYFKINEGNWTDNLNSMLTYRVLFGRDIASNVKIYGGPTANMMISKLNQSSDYAPYRLFHFDAKGRDYTFWIGFSLGVELL